MGFDRGVVSNGGCNDDGSVICFVFGDKNFEFKFGDIDWDWVFVKGFDGDFYIYGLLFSVWCVLFRYGNFFKVEFGDVISG